MTNSLMMNACFMGHYEEWDSMTNFYNGPLNGIVTASVLTRLLYFSIGETPVDALWS